MNRFRDSYGPWAFVAGASEGIGAAFAEEIARRGLNLVLVARREGPLEEVAKRVRAMSSVEVRIVPMDLGGPSLVDDVRRATEGLDIGLLVYNAALSHIGPFLKQSIEDKLRVIDVNCRGPVVLAHELGLRMAERKRGGIILMSSLAGSMGTPFVSTYAATKAFNLVLAEGLWDELKDNGVDVLACRAGATRTPAYERSAPAGPSPTPVMEPGPVAVAALDALGKSPTVVPGVFNGAVAFFMQRFLSRRAAVTTMGSATRKMYT